MSNSDSKCINTSKAAGQKSQSAYFAGCLAQSSGNGEVLKVNECM